MKHGCDSVLHGSPKALYLAVLALGVGRGKTLKDACCSACGRGVAGFEHGFRVELEYLNFWFDASEHEHVGLVLDYCLRCLAFPCGGIADDVA